MRTFDLTGPAQLHPLRDGETRPEWRRRVFPLLRQEQARELTQQEAEMQARTPRHARELPRR